MAELLTQHKIATTHPVRFLNTIEVLKSDFLTHNVFGSYHIGQA